MDETSAAMLIGRRMRGRGCGVVEGDEVEEGDGVSKS